MLHRNAEIVCNSGPQRSSCIVNSQTSLVDFSHDTLKNPHAFMMVEDDSGIAMGVVSVEDVRSRLNSLNPLEQRRWMEMPVEAMLNGKLASPGDAPHAKFSNHTPCDLPCTAVSEHERLIALVTDEDVLISWRSIAHLVQKAQIDHVTNLPTRTAFDFHLRSECERAIRCHHSVAVILIDVDHFKEINDQFGHPAGDAVLSAIGKTLRNTFRSYDMVARFGGDEFAVLCCGCRPGEIDFTLKRLHQGLQKLQSDLSIPRPIPTLSIGACVAHDPEHLEFPDHIIETADECLYFAKRDGRNRAFSRELGTESLALC